MRLDLILLLTLAATNSCAQSGGVSALEKEFSGRELGISRDVDADGAKRRKYLEDVTVSADNYYQKQVDGEYTKIIERLRFHANNGIFHHPEFRPKCRLGSDFAQTSYLVEGDFRVTFFYERSNAQRAMLTVFDVKRAKGKVIYPSYLTNKNIAGRQAVVLLGVARKPSDKGLWVATWAENDTMYELYAETDLDSQRKPRFDPRMFDSVLGSVVCE